MKKLLLAVLAVPVLLSFEARAQSSVSTLTTTNIGLNEPYNVVEDTNYNVYISDSVNNRIVKLDGNNNQVQSVLTGTTGSSGTSDGPAIVAQFSNPQGLLPVTIGGTAGLLVADTGNYLIRFVRLSDGYVITLAGQAGVGGSTDNAIGTSATFTAPYGLTQDTNGNVYICDLLASKIRVMNLNDPNFGVSSVAITGTTLYKPAAIAFMGTNQLWVADTENNAIKLITLSSATTGSLTSYMGSNDRRTTGTTDSPYGPNARFNQPRGLLWIPGFGLLISDTGNNSIRLATNNPAYGASNYAVATFAGTPGTAGSANGSPLSATFNSPVGLCLDPANGAFLVADLYNNSVRRILTGLPPPPPPAPIILSVTTNYGLVNLTWSTLSTATNYNVKRSGASGTETLIASTTGTNYSDANVLNGATYFYVVSASNAGGEGPNSVEVSATPPLPPVPDPQIGYVDFPATSLPIAYTSMFHPVPSYDFYNDATIVIKGTPGSGTHYEYGYTTNALLVTNPTPASASILSDYQDGLSLGQVSPYTISQVAPYLTIKAIGTKNDGSPNSAVVTATYQFITGNPNIIDIGNGAGGFNISDITANAHLYYTLDGSDPSSANPNAVDLGTQATTTNLWSVSFSIQANTLFKVRAFRNNYQPSAIVSNLFTTAGTHYTAITFGLTNGQPSSSFVARPGQFYYAPVTLQLTPGFDEMYSLQFNTTVTNGLAYNVTNLLVYTNSTIIFTNDVALSTNNTVLTNQLVFRYVSTQPSVITNGWFYTNTVIVATNGLAYTNTTSVTNELVYTNTRPLPPAIQNGAGLGFFPMLMTQVTPDEGTYFPPLDGNWYLKIPPYIYFTYQQILYTNINVPYATNIITTPTNSSIFINSANNLLGVGWLYRTGEKYKYFADPSGQANIDFDTTKQDLITYSIAHDTLFSKGGGTVVVGAYSFQIPFNANIGDQYFIQLGSPSATRDGVGAPGADVYIQAPANSQAVTVGSPSYLVGDAAPFRWLNAGDFGDTNLNNSDVMQVYQSAILVNAYGQGVDMPPTNSDLFAAMDSSGRFGNWDSVNQYYTDPGLAGNLAFATQQAMWDGNDQSINTHAFGDGVLDINDVYVTFRRSLDPSLVWFKRYWTNGQFVAVTTTNYAFNTNVPHLLVSKTAPTITTKAASKPDYRQSTINFSAGDAVVTANQTIQIPINAQIFGDYPLRVLGLNLTVVPLDGSPAITQPVTFTPVAGLGSPTITSSKGAANYSAAWLNSAISGLTGNTLIGTLTVTIPANATSQSAYAVHFDKASGSPNGLALFPKQTLTGLLTLSSRTNSTYGDGIPDYWRLRWFGTVNNLLSVSNACPTGDGINNWKKYVAGVDPNVANDFPSVNPKTPVPSGSTMAIHWPTVSGKQYAIERSASLFPGSWTTITTNTGTGTDMEFDDNSAGTANFYRVRIVP